MKLIMVDLDGTLFDTRQINYNAYRDAVNYYGYDIDYKYFCDFCNGRHYTEFLPKITTDDKNIIADIHARKKEAYSKYLSFGRINSNLLNIICQCKNEYKIALVTTASQKNAYDILKQFKVDSLFDLIVTGEDVKKVKPNPEGYLYAMKYFDSKPDECIIFEDSLVGIEAAIKTDATVFVCKGFN